MHSLNKEDDEQISEIDENLAGSESCNYTVRSERTGPALNISITEKKKKSRIPCYSGGSDCNAILDVDFTLALACPIFPKAAEISEEICKYSEGGTPFNFFFKETNDRFDVPL